MSFSNQNPLPFELKISDRINRVQPSGIRRFFDMANELKGQVLSLSIGEPDFVTPWKIREAGIYALEQGYTHYTANQGLLPLRQAIANYMSTRFSVDYHPEDEILVTVGGSEAIDDAIRALVNPGDEVIIPEPCFVAYRASVELAGGVVVPIALQETDQFKLTAEQLANAITDRTKLLILAFPNNPTGAVMTRAELEPIAELLTAHPQIMVMSDELYLELSYGDTAPVCFASLPHMRSRTVVIGGFSKAFAMTGWRIGYALAPAILTSAMNKVHQYLIMSSPTLAQYAAIEALNHCLPEVEIMREAYNQRRRYILNRLRGMGLPCFEPEGAFYIFPNIQQTGMSSMAFCEALLEAKKVAIIPGSAFGEAGEGYVRISYAASFEVIEAAMDRLEAFLAEQKKHA